MFTRLCLSFIKSHTTYLWNPPRQEICRGAIVANGASLTLSNLPLATGSRVGATPVFYAKIRIVLDCACFPREVSATDVRAPSLRVVPQRQIYCVIKYGRMLGCQKVVCAN